MVFFTFTAYAYKTSRLASNHGRVWLDENVAKNVANRRIALVLSMATNKSESEILLSLRHHHVGGPLGTPVEQPLNDGSRCFAACAPSVGFHLQISVLPFWGKT